MRITKDTLYYAQKLVGQMTVEDLKFVDFYVYQSFGIRIPKEGICKVAPLLKNIHPSYYFVIYFHPESASIPMITEGNPHHYLTTVLSPNVEYEKQGKEIRTKYMEIFIEENFFEEECHHYEVACPRWIVCEQFYVKKEVPLLLQKFVEECVKGAEGQSVVLKSIALLLTHEFIRSLVESVELVEKKSKPQISFDIENLISYMEEHYGSKLSISDLARINSISDSHLIRTFKEATGFSPIDYLIQLRIKKAEILLKAGRMNITEIAYRCGFSSPAHFSASFSKAMKVTPSQYQKSYRRKS